MTETSDNKQGLRTRLAIAGLVALMCAGAGISAAESAHSAEARVIGKTKKGGSPSCPRDTNKDPCDTTGTVTGIQLKGHGQDRLMRVPADGKIVAWKLVLANLKNSQAEFFGGVLGNERYGEDPTARIAALKRVNNGKFKLQKQGPVMNLKNYLGETPIFALKKSIPVKKGRWIGLTMPTYAPTLSSALGPRAGNSKWVASRPKKSCDKSATTASPHQKIGSTRAYGCRFDDRINYSAFFVPDKK